MSSEIHHSITANLCVIRQCWPVMLPELCQSQGEKVSRTASAQPPIPVKLLSDRQNVSRGLLGWSVVVVRGRMFCPVGLDLLDPMDSTDLLLDHVDWLAESERANEADASIAAMAEICQDAAKGSLAHHYPVGVDCPDVQCAGRLFAYLGGSLTEIRCDRNEAHVYGKDQWQRLGWDVGRRSLAGYVKLRRCAT